MHVESTDSNAGVPLNLVILRVEIIYCTKNHDNSKKWQRKKNWTVRKINKQNLLKPQENTKNKNKCSSFKQKNFANKKKMYQ